MGMAVGHILKQGGIHGQQLRTGGHCHWAGAEMRVFTLSNLIITDQRTNGQTKPLVELRVRN